MFPTLTFELRSCDPAMDWDYQLSVCGDEVSEIETDFNEEAKEYWGWEEEEEEYEDDDGQLEQGGPYAPHEQVN